MFAPKLCFKFKHQPPYCHKTEMRGPGVRFSVYYFRFIIANDGNRQADSCEAILEKIYKENSAGQMRRIEGFSPVNLKWSGSRGLAQGKETTIQPGREAFCDIGRIHHPEHQPESAYQEVTEEDRTKNKFFFELPTTHFSQWDCLVPGKYAIDVSVYSKNAKKISKRFLVSWSGSWNDRESEMLDELVIS